jgi:phage shock protein C
MDDDTRVPTQRDDYRAPAPGGRPRVARSRTDRVLAGVCGGIAAYLGWNPTHVRIGYVLLSILSAGFPGILVYLILWFVMPQESQEPREFRVRHPDR